MTSQGTNYVLNEHLDFSQQDWYKCNNIRDDILIQLPCKFQESNWNPGWVIALMNSSDANYKDLGQYDLYAMPSQRWAGYSYLASWMNQNEIPIDLLC